MIIEVIKPKIVHSVPMGLIRFWMASAREELGIEEAKGWAYHKWNERRQSRNSLPHLPTTKHRRHKDLSKLYDNFVDRICPDGCKICLVWIEKVLHRQSGYHTFEDQRYILAFHSQQVKEYNDADIGKYVNFIYPYSYTYYDYEQRKDLRTITISPWDWKYHEDDDKVRKQYK